MTGKIKYLLYREGRYFTRLVIPKKLRSFLEGKSELRIALGADRRDAMRKHPMATADLMHQIALAERRLAEASGALVALGRYPLKPAQIALRSYHARLQQDETARNSLSAYAKITIDDGFVTALRNGIAGRLENPELEELVGHRIQHFQMLGNTTAEFGSPEWRDLARAICISEYEALARVSERDEGDYSGLPTNPLLLDVEPEVVPPVPVSLRGLFNDYIASRQQLGKGREAERRWAPVIEHLRKHLGHDDANRITKQDLMAWRDKLMLTLSPKTVSQVYLASVRTLFNWAVREDRLSNNPAETVRQEVPKPVKTRPKGFTLEEAERVLSFSLSYRPKAYLGRASAEHSQTSAAKCWVPLLCAFTGARVTEMTQLRKEDILMENTRYFLRITPDAGSVKSYEYRDVPLHQQIVALGFLDFVDKAPSGPLFYRTKNGHQKLASARMVSGRISEWLGANELVPAKVSPNHGWRHRFKTITLELGGSDRIIDAICGHAGRTAGDGYGEVSLKAKALLIDVLPAYSIDQAVPSPIGDAADQNAGLEGTAT